MEQILPLIIICSVGIASCITVLIFLLCKHVVKLKQRHRKEEFELDEKTLTVKLDKKDFRKLR